jgi:hypothetical protein
LLRMFARWARCALKAASAHACLARFLASIATVARSLLGPASRSSSLASFCCLFQLLSPCSLVCPVLLQLLCTLISAVSVQVPGSPTCLSALRLSLGGCRLGQGVKGKEEGFAGEG